MKTNCIIVHGHPSKEDYYNPTNSIENANHWMPYLRKELCGRGIATEMPLMPNAYNPVYEDWKKYFEMFPVNEQTILVGHSRGGAFIIRWLVETQQKVRGVFMVAPAAEGNWNNHQGMKLNFRLQPEYSVASDNLYIYVSDNDSVVQPAIGKDYAKKLNAKLIELTGRGHFTRSGMGQEEFPELLDDILSVANT